MTTLEAGAEEPDELVLRRKTSNGSGLVVFACCMVLLFLGASVRAPVESLTKGDLTTRVGDEKFSTETGVCIGDFSNWLWTKSSKMALPEFCVGVALLGVSEGPGSVRAGGRNCWRMSWPINELLFGTDFFSGIEGYGKGGGGGVLFHLQVNRAGIFNDQEQE